MGLPSKNVFVFSEDQEVFRELLGKGREIADQLGGELSTVRLGGAEAVEIAQTGFADKIYCLEGSEFKVMHVETYTDALTEILVRAKPIVGLFGGTKRGLELVSRLAQRTGASCISHCVAVEGEKTKNCLMVQAMSYSGLGLATYRFTGEMLLLSIDPHTFKPKKSERRVQSPEVISVKAEIQEPRLKIIGTKVKVFQDERLEDARVIVDVGQGIKKKEDLAMIETLSHLLGGKVACTRPLSADRDWFPHWLGLSDKKVSPDLCLAIGVSGAIQHTVGIRESKVVVAVNTDEEAPIFLQADYGIVGDLYEIVPALIEALKKRSMTS